MLKRLLLLVVLTVLLVGFAQNALAAEYYDYEKIVELTVGEKAALINDEPTQMDEAAYIQNGRTLVPLRFLGEALGASVDWNGSTKTAALSLQGETVKVTIGSKNAYVGSELSVLDVPAEIKSGRTFVPLRFISEAFGAVVNYDGSTKGISVVLVDQTGWETLGEGLLYPPDWAGEITEDGIIYYSSPQGSEVWLQLSEEEMGDVETSFQESAEDLGYTFIDEELLDPSNEALGKKLLFFEFDSDDNPMAAYEITLEQTEEGVLIKELYVPLEAAKPDMVIVNILVEQ